MSTTTLKITRDGIVLAPAAVTPAGDNFRNTGREFLVVKNDSGSDVAVSLKIQQEVDGVLPAPRSVTVSDGDIVFIGPFPTDEYNNDDGCLEVTYDSSTDVFIAWFRLMTEV